MSEYKAYFEYKNLGIEWLGETPKDWKVKPLKRIGYILSGYAFDSSLFIKEGVRVLKISNVQTLKLDWADESFIDPEYYQRFKYFAVLDGDIVFALTRPIISTGIKVAIAYIKDEKILLNQRNACLRFFEGFYKEYFYYVLFSQYFFIQFENSIDATGQQPNISPIDIGNLKVLCPSYAEQQKIADFLDYETSKIDQLINKQKALIELLKEKRQALISQAVTKGLDPNVKMKDSGIEWLGEVPKHWEIKRLKYIGNAIIGLTYSPNDIVSENEGILVLRSSNIQNGVVVNKDNIYVSKDISEKLILKINDILICSRNGSRNLIGKNGLVTEEFENCTFGAFMTIFRSEYYHYLYYVFNSNIFTFQSASFSTSTINQLTTENLNNFEVPIPPEDECIEIYQYLKTHTHKIDILIVKATNAVNLLKERRTALISAAVTGKIDVRDWQSPNTVDTMTNITPN